MQPLACCSNDWKCPKLAEASLRNISGHTAIPLAYTVILDRYQRRFDCRRGISRWWCWFGLLLLLVVADADVNWLWYFLNNLSGIFQVIYFQWPIAICYMSTCLHSPHRPCWALFLGTTSPAADGFVVCSLVTRWLRDETRMWRVDC